MKTVSTFLHCYNFDTSKPEEALKYKKLCTMLKNKGLHKFDAWSDEFSLRCEFYKKHITPFDGKKIKLDATHIFSNQWNSESGARVFDWREENIPNTKGIYKSGYWLEPTEEIKRIRSTTLSCGYCGKQRKTKTKNGFCNSCLDSEYLEESQIHLLRLFPISSKENRKELTKEEEKELLPLFSRFQTVATTERQKTKAKEKRDSIEKELEKSLYSARTKYAGFTWLLDNNVPIENCIYYSHTEIFCFGWKKELGHDATNALREKLEEFPFSYKIESSTLGTIK